MKQLCDDADKTMTLLKDDHQTAWVMLSRSLSQQMDYLLTMQYPSDTLEAASLMDSRIWAALGRLAEQSHIPREEEGLGVECVPLVPGVPSLEGRSFQRWLVQQPVKLGGLGLRSLVEVRASAFVGGVEQSVPFMVGLGGQPAIAPQLEEIVGKVEGQNRWCTFLGAGSRTAKEFLEPCAPYPRKQQTSGGSLDRNPQELWQSQQPVQGGLA